MTIDHQDQQMDFLKDNMSNWIIEKDRMKTELNKAETQLKTVIN